MSVSQSECEKEERKVLQDDDDVDEMMIMKLWWPSPYHHHQRATEFMSERSGFAFWENGECMKLVVINFMP